MSAAFSGIGTALDALELLVRATVLIGAAWACAAALRRAGASASARHIAWLLGIAALLALPLLWWAAPALRLPILSPEAAAPAAAVLRQPAPPAGPAAAGMADAWEWGRLLLVAYLAGAAVLLLRLALFRKMLERLWRRADSVREAEWLGLLAEVAGEIGIDRRVELRIARGPAMPMTWGTLAPRVLLPAEANGWSAERRRLVLLHELAHVARRDSLARSTASLACALWWFHPGAWFAARQMRLEQEHAADDRVLSAGAPARRYALSLVDLARRSENSAGLAAAMAGMEQLERRLVSITRPARRNRPGPAFLVSSALVAGSVTLIVSSGVPVSASPLLPDPLSVRAAASRASETPRAVPAPARVTASRSVEAGAVLRVLAGRTQLADRPTPRATSQAQVHAPVAVQTDPAIEAREQAEVSTIQREPSRGRPRPSPVDRPQLAAYGPQLPAALSETDSDARIPELARRPARSGADERAGRARHWALPIQVVPADDAGMYPLPSGLSLQLVAN